MKNPREAVDITLPAEIARCLHFIAEGGWISEGFTDIPDHGAYTVPGTLYGAICLAAELAYLIEDIEDGKIPKPHPSAAEVEMTRRAVLVASGDEDLI